MEFVLSRAEVQEVLCYLGTFSYKGVLFPTRGTFNSELPPLQERKKSRTSLNITSYIIHSLNIILSNHQPGVWQQCNVQKHADMIP